MPLNCKEGLPATVLLTLPVPYLPPRRAGLLHWPPRGPHPLITNGGEEVVPVSSCPSLEQQGLPLTSTWGLQLLPLAGWDKGLPTHHSKTATQMQNKKPALHLRAWCGELVVPGAGQSMWGSKDVGLVPFLSLHHPELKGRTASGGMQNFKLHFLL